MIDLCCFNSKHYLTTYVIRLRRRSCSNCALSIRRLSIENSAPGAIDICSDRVDGMSDPDIASDELMPFTSIGTT